MRIVFSDDYGIQSKIETDCIRVIYGGSKGVVLIPISQWIANHIHQSLSNVSIESYPILSPRPELSTEIPPFIIKRLFPKIPTTFQDLCHMVIAILRLIPENFIYSQTLVVDWIGKASSEIRKLPDSHAEYILSEAWNVVIYERIQNHPLVAILIYKMFGSGVGEFRVPTIADFNTHAPSLLDDFIYDDCFLSNLSSPGSVTEKEWMRGFRKYIFKALSGSERDMSNVARYLKTAEIHGITKQMPIYAAVKMAFSHGSINPPGEENKDWSSTGNLLAMMGLLYRYDPTVFADCWTESRKKEWPNSRGALPILRQNGFYLSFLHDPKANQKLIASRNYLDIVSLDYFMGLINHNKLLHEIDADYSLVFKYFLLKLKSNYHTATAQAHHIMSLPYYYFMQFWVWHLITGMGVENVGKDLITAYSRLTEPDFRILPILMFALGEAAPKFFDYFMHQKRYYEDCLLGSVFVKGSALKNGADQINLPRSCRMVDSVNVARALAYLFYFIPFSMSSVFDVPAARNMSIQDILNALVADIQNITSISKAKSHVGIIVNVNL